MGTTIGDLTEKVRSLLWGTQFDERTLLAAPYAPGDSELHLDDALPNIGHGSIVCCGLNTFYVMRSGAGGSTLRVIPSIDGGPDEALTQGSVLLIKPRTTTWAIFRELHDAIADLASPMSGLFQPMSFEADYNYQGFYPVPQGWFDAAVQPQKFLRASYRTNPEQNWIPIFGAEWLPERYAVQILDQPSEARTLEFTFGFPYRTPTTLTDEMFDLGLTEKSTQNLPPLRAASRLFMGMEGQRVQPKAQGDSRRPGEVPPTSNTSLSREWQRQYDSGVDAEKTRLQALFTPTFPIGDR